MGNRISNQSACFEAQFLIDFKTAVTAQEKASESVTAGLHGKHIAWSDRCSCKCVCIHCIRLATNKTSNAEAFSQFVSEGKIDEQSTGREPSIVIIAIYAGEVTEGE